MNVTPQRHRRCPHRITPHDTPPHERAAPPQRNPRQPNPRRFHQCTRRQPPRASARATRGCPFKGFLQPGCLQMRPRRFVPCPCHRLRGESGSGDATNTEGGADCCSGCTFCSPNAETAQENLDAHWPQNWLLYGDRRSPAATASSRHGRSKRNPNKTRRDRGSRPDPPAAKILSGLPL